MGLTLFHLVLLAFVVHKLAPIYSLFESQCYSRTQTCPDPVSGPRILLPSDYLPQEFGQFCGITINGPHVVAAVVSTVKSHFKKSKEGYEQKVKFLLLSSHYLLNPPKLLAPRTRKKTD